MKYSSSFLLFALLIVMFAISSCSPKYFKSRHFEKMKWIEGQWSSTEQGITITEIWKHLPQNGFDGTGFIVAGRDTLFKEQMQIRTGPKSTIVFSSKAGRVQFEIAEPMKLRTLKTKSFVFQTDSKHKTVRYVKRKNNSLLIDITEITGNETTRTKYILNLTE